MAEVDALLVSGSLLVLALPVVSLVGLTLLALHVLELHGHRLLPPGIVGWFVRRVDHLALIRPELLNAPSYLRQPSAVTNLLVLAVIALIGPILTALSG